MREGFSAYSTSIASCSTINRLIVALKYASSVPGKKPISSSPSSAKPTAMAMV